MNLFKTFNQVVILAALSLSAFAVNAKASVCYIDSNGFSRRGEIVQTEYVPPSPAIALIHATFLNGAPVYNADEQWVPFTEFSDCDSGRYFDYFYFNRAWGPGFRPYPFVLLPFGHYWGWRPGLDLRFGHFYGEHGEFRGPRGFDGRILPGYHGEGPGAFRGHEFQRGGPVVGPHGGEFNHSPVGPRPGEFHGGAPAPHVAPRPEAPRGVPGGERGGENHGGGHR